MDASNTKPYNLPSDAVWFITGCSSGIGESLAKLIARSPNRLVATARNPASLSYIEDGPDTLKLTLDVTSKTAIEEAISKTLAKFGRIDVLVNNAGFELIGDTESSTDEEAHLEMNTNFWGTVNATKIVLGIMRDENPKNGGQQGGVIINVSSMGGFMGFPGGAFYHASKFAVEGWTESVAKELPTEWNIHFCIIEPGGTETNFATSSLREMSHRHPAYTNPKYPTNSLLSHMRNAENRKHWTRPDAVATAIYKLVSEGKRIPIRIPFGADAFGMISLDIENIKKDLEEFKEISLGVGALEQMDSITFLKKA
ncbi:NAD(P)-binding protein [Annulohypoxylon maeteangense]|uniref:NAD(P)-binding protein n=1 Tax=Annulohypoxylon maeteangense TaxID=1927788 RepID=UPI0020074578|nr:NAD(P)-binding protein [Annulohypoxylon maeteangense]KAI0883877.1 NAD(P)-binding protein [Annulohypoxylon maeteangense]